MRSEKYEYGSYVIIPVTELFYLTYIKKIVHLSTMNENLILQNLDELARKLCIKIIHDKKLTYTGGFCQYNGSYYLIIKSKIATHEEIQLYTKAISRVVPEDYYVLPVIRELLDRELANQEGEQ